MLHPSGMTMDPRGDQEFRQSVVQYLLSQEAFTATTREIGKVVPKTLSKDAVVGVSFTALLKKWPETFIIKKFGRVRNVVQVLVTLKALEASSSR